MDKTLMLNFVKESKLFLNFLYVVLNHAKNISAFINAIEERRKFEIDGIEARKAVALISDIYESAQNTEITKSKN